MTGWVRVWLAGEDDVPAAAAALAAGSADEAAASWVMPGEAARRRWAAAGAGAMAVWLKEARETGDLLLAGPRDGEVVGVALWERREPGQLDREPSQETAAAMQRLYGEYLERLVTLRTVTEERHPAHVPHWYLAQTVVVPEWRGRGYGGALLRHQLARADEESAAAYLEASSPRNQALYERHGFRPLGEPVRVPGGGLTVQPMWRQGRSPHALP
ncbi:GNAT family N-acetyltransferase [Streptomyces sp. 7-21]|uniref:GNAT family N-acetyltransferase n=1 Tax=Streptomyces sp. 7-21 TaxID=2802283 RepID=UPI00191E763A|nr:GNAT family N-acetyltransferase [Streptomyces sp. 7-21]MBL1067510.1 GNAT family N-acetyltransferase [Streptomyces sp. 7-21]